MIPIEEITKLDQEFMKLSMPFDKGLPILREMVWKLADKYGTDGPEVLKQYFDWKSKNI